MIIVCYNKAQSDVSYIMSGCVDYRSVEASDSNLDYYTISEAEYSNGVEYVKTLYASKTPTELLNILKLGKKDKISEYREGIEKNGFNFTFYDGSGMVQTDPTSVRNIGSLVTDALIAKSLNDDSRQYGFRDFDNVTHMMTASEIINLGLVSSDFIRFTYLTSWTKKAEVDALVTENSVRSYNYTSGWSYTPIAVDKGKDVISNKPSDDSAANISTTATDKVRVYRGNADASMSLTPTTGNGRVLTVKNASNYKLTVTANGADLIDGFGTFILARKCSITIVDSKLGYWDII